MLASLSSSSISLATVTPSLVTVGAPQLFSITTLRPRGPSVTLTALARTFRPYAMFWRALLPNTISLAAIFVLRYLTDHREDVFLAQDEVFFAVNFNLAARILREQHLVARLDLELAYRSVVQD